VLEGVACCGLLVVLSIIADLEGGRPRDTGEFEDPGVTTSDISRQGCAQTLHGLLYLQGGGSCHALRGIVLLRDHGGMAPRRSLLLGGDDGLGGRWLRRPRNVLDSPYHRGWGRGHVRLCNLEWGTSTITPAV
jgi:hypothetical protein